MKDLRNSSRKDAHIEEKRTKEKGNKIGKSSSLDKRIADIIDKIFIFDWCRIIIRWVFALFK